MLGAPVQRHGGGRKAGGHLSRAAAKEGGATGEIDLVKRLQAARQRGTAA